MTVGMLMMRARQAREANLGGMSEKTPERKLWSKFDLGASPAPGNQSNKHGRAKGWVRGEPAGKCLAHPSKS